MFLFLLQITALKQIAAKAILGDWEDIPRIAGGALHAVGEDHLYLKTVNRETIIIRH